MELNTVIERILVDYGIRIRHVYVIYKYRYTR